MASHPKETANYSRFPPPVKLYSEIAPEPGAFTPKPVQNRSQRRDFGLQVDLRCLWGKPTGREIGANRSLRRSAVAISESRKRGAVVRELQISPTDAATRQEP